MADPVSFAIITASLIGAGTSAGVALSSRSKTGKISEPHTTSRADKAKLAAAAEAKQQRKIQAAQGRQSTILTSPLGQVDGSAPGSPKTLLGQ